MPGPQSAPACTVPRPVALRPGGRSLPGVARRRRARQGTLPAAPGCHTPPRRSVRGFLGLPLPLGRRWWRLDRTPDYRCPATKRGAVSSMIGRRAADRGNVGEDHEQGSVRGCRRCCDGDPCRFESGATHSPEASHQLQCVQVEHGQFHQLSCRVCRPHLPRAPMAPAGTRPARARPARSTKPLPGRMPSIIDRLPGRARRSGLARRCGTGGIGPQGSGITARHAAPAGARRPAFWCCPAP